MNLIDRIKKALTKKEQGVTDFGALQVKPKPRTKIPPEPKYDAPIPLTKIPPEPKYDAPIPLTKIPPAPVHQAPKPPMSMADFNRARAISIIPAKSKLLNPKQERTGIERQRNQRKL